AVRRGVRSGQDAHPRPPHSPRRLRERSGRPLRETAPPLVIEEGPQRRDALELGRAVEDRGTARIPLRGRNTRGIDVPVRETPLVLFLHRARGTVAEEIVLLPRVPLAIVELALIVGASDVLVAAGGVRGGAGGGLRRPVLQRCAWGGVPRGVLGGGLGVAGGV